MVTLKRLRWWIVALVCMGTVLNYLARNSLGVLAPQLTKDLGFTTQQYSWVVAAFQVTYTAMQPVCGAIIDSLGLKLAFALFAVAWSLANMAHGFAGGWISLAFFRGLLGLSESAAIPAGVKAVSEWFPARDRSVAIGFFNAGTSRAAAFTLGAVMMIAPASVGLAFSPYTAIGLFCVGGFAHQMLSVSLNTLTTDVFPRESVARANGFVGMCGWIGGLLFSLLVGALADTVGYGPLFRLLAVFDIAGALILFAVLRPLRLDARSAPA